jgi:hypothetical protein
MELFRVTNSAPLPTGEDVEEEKCKELEEGFLQALKEMKRIRVTLDLSVVLKEKLDSRVLHVIVPSASELHTSRVLRPTHANPLSIKEVISRAPLFCQCPPSLSAFSCVFGFLFGDFHFFVALVFPLVGLSLLRGCHFMVLCCITWKTHKPRGSARRKGRRAARTRGCASAPHVGVFCPCSPVKRNKRCVSLTIVTGLAAGSVSAIVHSLNLNTLHLSHDTSLV